MGYNTSIGKGTGVTQTLSNGTPRNAKGSCGRGYAQIRQWTLKRELPAFGEGVRRVSPELRFRETLRTCMVDKVNTFGLGKSA